MFSPVTGWGAWRNGKFLADELADPSISGETADPDGDGYANLLEYAFGAEPKTPSTHIGPTTRTENGYLTLTYRKSKIATDLTYTPVARGSLSTGDWDPTGLVAADPEDKGDYWEIKVRDAVPVNSATSRFMRLQVTR